MNFSVKTIPLYLYIFSSIGKWNDLGMYSIYCIEKMIPVNKTPWKYHLGMYRETTSLWKKILFFLAKINNYIMKISSTITLILYPLYLKVGFLKVHILN